MLLNQYGRNAYLSKLTEKGKSEPFITRIKKEKGGGKIKRWIMLSGSMQEFFCWLCVGVKKERKVKVSIGNRKGPEGEMNVFI